jgi:hypothetical protein
LIQLDHDGKMIGAIYCHHHRGVAYYGSGADDPDVEPPVPLYHAMVWKALEYYRSREFTHFDMGVQEFGPQLFDQPSEKALNIAKFKHGFGGQTVSMFRGVKFYDRGLMERELSSRVTALVRRVFSED